MSLYAELSSVIGENAEQQGVSMWLDSGIPELNKALSGNFENGFPVGRMIEIFGEASSGKSFLATMAMIEAQKAGGLACFSDHERSFEESMAVNLGLKTDVKNGDLWVYKRPKTFEESVDLAIHTCELVRSKKLIPDTAPIVWVFDSVPSMIPHEVLFDSDGKRRGLGDHNMRTRLALAAATSKCYPLLAQFAEDNHMLILLLNQIRLDPGAGQYADPKRTPGGKAAEFYCSIRLSLGRSMVDNGLKRDAKIVLGQDITAQAVKNKCARPFNKAKWAVRFEENGPGVHVDMIETMVDYLLRVGAIEKAGSRIVWDGKNIYRAALIKTLKDKDPVKVMALLKSMLPAVASQEAPEDSILSEV